MITDIGIFKGKAKENNILLLETLYDKGPLTAWELTQEAPKYGSEVGDRRSLHSIYNKRLRVLESKGYVQRAQKKWLFQFKGMIAVLLIQEHPRLWSTKWTKLFKDFVTPIMRSPKKYSITEDDEEIVDFKVFISNLIQSLENYESWVALADKVKNYMEGGVINLDLISNETLLLLLIQEAILDTNLKMTSLSRLLKLSK